MKKIIILLTTLLLVYNDQSYSVRQAKKQGFIRVSNGELSNNNNNTVNRNLNQMGNIKNSQIKTLPGFANMKLLDPNALNQVSTAVPINNNVMQSDINPSYTNNNQQNLNVIPFDNNSIHHNHHTANSQVVPMTLANQMNTIYNQNKQNKIPHGSAYESYQSQHNNPHVGLALNQTQMQVPYQPSSQTQQSSLPTNNQNQVNTPLLGNYFNNQYA
jgi:hypothetical protein